MAEPQPAAKVAKELNIYLGQIYPMVQKGLVKNHKPDGKYNVEGGKGLEVDIDEVRAAMANGRKRGGGKGTRGPKAGSKAHARLDPVGAETARRARGQKTPGVGALISRHKGLAVLADDPRRLLAIEHGWDILTITGTYRNNIIYTAHNGAPNKNTVFWSDALREHLARGQARIERPEGVLGMVIFQWLTEGKLELAEGLEAWMESAGIEVSIPEPVVMDEAAGADEPYSEDEDEVADDDED